MRPELSLSHLVTVLGLLFFLGSNGQNHENLCFHDEEYRYQPEKLIDLEHLTARITIDPYEKAVVGSADFLFRQIRSDVDSAVFLAPGFAIKSIRLDRKDVSYTQRDNKLIVYLPEFTKKGATHELAIAYSTRPAFDLFFVGWDDPTNRRIKQIWAHRPFQWLPYADDRLTVDMYVTFDDDYMVFSNGVREQVTQNPDNTKTWHYKMYRNHPFFSTALVIGKYQFNTYMTKKGLPYELWYYPDRKESVEPTYRYMPEMIAFCENEFGLPYPYEVYRQAPVTDYLYGGMETTTSTVFGDFMHIDDRAFWERNYVNVNIHELVHQWYGNYVSHLRHPDVWLTESFATYYAKLFEREVYGEDYYQWERIKEKQRVLLAAQKDNLPIAHSRAGVDRWYPKGSLVLDMLRDELGDKDFRRIMTHYLKQHAYQEAWTPDLMRAVQEVTGRSTDHFFEQWVLRGGEPKIEIHQTSSVNKIQFTIVQKQEVDAVRPLYNFKTKFEMHFDDGSKELVPVHIKDAEHHIEYSWNSDAKVSFVIFDPGDRILKTMSFQRSVEALLAQAAQAENLIDRHEALLALRESHPNSKRAALIQLFHREVFHVNKSEIIAQLASDTNLLSIELFAIALGDSDPFVRRTAINNLKMHHPINADIEHSILSDTSYSNIVLGLKKLTQLYPEHTDSYLEKTKHEQGFPGLNIRIEWLRIAVSAGKQNYISELIDYSGGSFDFLTRINAINALASIRHLDEVFASHLVDGATHWNFRLRPVAELVIKDYLNDPLKKVMIHKAYAGKGIGLPAELAR